MGDFQVRRVNTCSGTKAHLWPILREGYGRGKITSLEVASIAFVWSAATPLPAFRLFTGRCPTPHFYERLEETT